jgi:hypothetical protein
VTIDSIDTVTVLGAGSMGHGITEVVALAGYDVTMRDIEEDIVQDGYDDIEWSLEKLDEKGLIDQDPDEVLSRISTTVDLEEATHKSISVAVVRAVADLTETHIDEMPPLAETIDPEALDNLVQPAIRDPGVSAVEISFRYCDFQITISATGEMVIRHPDAV